MIHSGKVAVWDSPQEKSRDIAEVSRRLSDLNIDLIKDSRATIQATHELVRATREALRRSRNILNDDQDSTFEADPEDLRRAAVNVPADIIVIGGSAGSQMAVRTIVDRLPEGFSAIVFIVQHSSPGWAAELSVELLQAHTAIPVNPARGFVANAKNTVYYSCIITKCAVRKGEKALLAGQVAVHDIEEILEPRRFAGCHDLVSIISLQHWIARANADADDRLQGFRPVLRDSHLCKRPIECPH